MKQLKYRSAAFLLSNKLDPNAIERVFRAHPMVPSTELNYVNKANIKLAAVQMELRPYRSLSDFILHLQEIVAQAQEHGAQLVSFPEYVGLLPLLISPTFRELGEDFFDALEEGKLEDCRNILNYFSEELSELLFSCYYNTFALLANRSHLYIHAGSTLLASGGKVYERCFLFGPDGEAVLEQDKLFLSPLEQELGICPGEELELCDSPLGRLAILPGQDSFFYETAKAARQLGAQILLCPLRPVQQDFPFRWQSRDLRSIRGHTGHPERYRQPLCLGKPLCFGQPCESGLFGYSRGSVCRRQQSGPRPNVSSSLQRVPAAFGASASFDDRNG